jgi:heat shock protein HslJ
MVPFRAALAALALSAGALPAAAQESRTVEGSLTYLARIALPPTAEMVLEAVAVNGESLALFRRPTEGAQVPLAFSFELPRGEAAEVHAAILHGGRTEWAALPVPVTPAAGVADLGEIKLFRYRPVGFDTTMLCGDRRIRLAFDGARALLDTRQGVIELAQVPAASGARYEAAERSAMVWTKGATAMVEIDGDALPECAVVPPVGAPAWTATGHAPGWTLEVSGAQMLLDRRGEAPVQAALPDAAIEEGGFTYAAEAMDLRVVPEICRDSATGRPHPERVRVTLDGATLEGCGGDPMALLSGGEWVVEDMGESGVIDDARSYIVFARDGAITGSGGCNRFTGRMALTGEAARIGPVAATMMACPEAVMRQERMFFGVLEAMDAWDFDETGALRLMANDAPLALLRR